MIASTQAGTGGCGALLGCVMNRRGVDPHGHLIYAFTCLRLRARWADNPASLGSFRIVARRSERTD